jgi:predicted nucleotidyltransferase
LDRAVTKEVVAVQVKVASLSDLVEGKIRAWSDPARRLSKRAKDQADLLRIAERYPEMVELLPERLKAEIAEDRAARLHREDAGGTRSAQPRVEREPPEMDR